MNHMATKTNHPISSPRTDHHSARLMAALTGMRFLRFLPLLVLAVSLGITYFLWQDARQNAMQALQADFIFDVQEVQTRIGRRMANYEQVLRGAKGLFAASVNVERDEFHDYVAMLWLAENYPGIQGIGFALIVPQAQKDRHIAAVRKEGFPGYTIHPEGEREIYTSVIYLEPFDERNRRAFGYDMYSDLEHPRDGDIVPGVRRAAMEQARDSGKAVISGKVSLLMEIDENTQAGTLLYLPIYKNGMKYTTVAERRANIIGWVYAPFRMDDLMAGILGEHAAEFDIEIFDGEELSEESLLYDDDKTHHAGGRLESLFKTVKRLEVNSRVWTMAAYSLPAFEARLDREKPQIVANAATGVSLLLSLIVWLLVRGHRRNLQTTVYFAENEARLKEMFGYLDRGVAIYKASPDGLDFTLIALNPAAERIENIACAEVIGKNVTEAFPGITKMGLLKIFQRVWQSGAAEHFPAAYYEGERVSGWRENYVFKLSSGELVAVYNDVTERKMKEERTEYEAHYDALTHLPNRTLITDRIRQALASARRDQTHVALMFVDLDKFKPVNDEFGHEIGDLLLQEVAKRLQSCMRESDTAARLGGDEFIVLLPSIEAQLAEAEQDAMLVAEKIRQALSQPFELSGHRLEISCSIGVAVCPEHGSNEEQLLNHADNAMYQAKQGGRNTVKTYRAGMQAKS